MKRLFLCIFVLLLIPIAAMAWGPTKSLISPTTAAATYTLNVPEGLGSSLQLVGTLAGAEEIVLERCVTWTDESTCAAWETLAIGGSTVAGLSATNHVITMYGAMHIRLNKPTTAAAAGVDWQR